MDRCAAFFGIMGMSPENPVFKWVVKMPIYRNMHMHIRVVSAWARPSVFTVLLKDIYCTNYKRLKGWFCENFNLFNNILFLNLAAIGVCGTALCCCPCTIAETACYSIPILSSLSLGLLSGAFLFLYTAFSKNTNVKSLIAF